MWFVYALDSRERDGPGGSTPTPTITETPADTDSDDTDREDTDRDPDGDHEADTLKMPRLIDRSVHDAKQALDPGWHGQFLSRRQDGSATAEEDVVIRQDPDPGEPVRFDQDVSVEAEGGEPAATDPPPIRHRRLPAGEISCFGRPRS